MSRGSWGDRLATALAYPWLWEDLQALHVVKQAPPHGEDFPVPNHPGASRTDRICFAITPEADLSQDRLDNFFKADQEIWSDVSGRWIEFRKLGKSRTQFPAATTVTRRR